MVQASPAWSIFTLLLLFLTALTPRAGRAEGRQRPHLDSRRGHQVLLTDNHSLLRGVSLSFDGGDPYGSLPKVVPSQASLNALATDYGLNAVHLYLEGNSSMNPNPVGYNAADADLLVQRTREAGLYLIVTIGNNGENGNIHSMDYAQDFWEFYAPRYKDETHVIYEAHNEPVAFTLHNWTTADWDRQATLYHTIRNNAPETFTLLGSFMGFVGDPRFGANYLRTQGVDWSNAGFAHHGYESLGGIENAISLMEQSASFPALLNTEFWPGDTNGQGYNSMYESHYNGWMQFQWLGANDEDLHDFRARIDEAGTVWTPDSPAANWPARATPSIPTTGTAVGLYSRGTQQFLSATPANNLNVQADQPTYSANANDSFIVEQVDDRLVALKSPHGFYLSTSGESDALTAQATSIGANELFEWIRLPNGDITLRAFGGDGHLWKTTNDGLVRPQADDRRDRDANFVVVTQPHTTPAALVGDPFHGVPSTVPGVVEAEAFDLGGSGRAYSDTTASNQGGKYRPLDAVDIETTADIGGGYNVGWIQAGEWIEYTIDVESTGEYLVATRVATTQHGSAFRLEFDGIDETGAIKVPNTGGYQNWTTVFDTVHLERGSQIMRFVTSGTAEFNVNRFAMTLVQLSCDFDGDGVCDSSDLDALQTQGPLTTGAPATGNERFDLNDDGLINLADRDHWLLEAALENGLSAAYLPADANLDGVVDGQDFIAWNNGKFTSSLLWSSGDFNADGLVDGQDFILWNNHKFLSLSPQTVPEPTGAFVLWASLLSCVYRRYRQVGPA